MISEGTADVLVSADLYGFPLRSLTVVQQARRLQCEGSTLRTEAEWLPSVHAGQLPPPARLKDLARRGVPPALRPLVWLQASGAEARRAAALPGKNYTDAAAAGEASKWLPHIEQDVQQTFSAHPWLGQLEGQAALRRVLAAFSMHNPVIGYARGLNNVSALLLVVFNRNEESAFWTLSALVESILVNSNIWGAAPCGEQQLLGGQVEAKALGELVSHKLPRLAAHLAALDADVSLLALEWFTTLFSGSLPSETVARVWDSLLVEGPKVLHRTALALLQAHESALLATDSAGELLLAARAAAAEAHDRDSLMTAAFDGLGGLSMAAIDLYRQQQEQACQQEAIGGGGGGGSNSPTARAPQQRMGDLGKQAGVLGRQAASNLRKGLGRLAAAVAEQRASGSREPGML